MTDGGAEAAIFREDEAVHAALRLWAREPRLECLVSEPPAAYLILDAAGKRLIHAAPGARILVDALAPDPTHRALPPSLTAQIEGLGEIGSLLRLARLRFDPRRIGVPTTCLLARRMIGADRAVLLVVLMEKAPILRARVPQDAPPASAPEALPRAGTKDDASPSPPFAQPPAAGATVGDRFIWRTDAAGVFTDIVGQNAEVLRPVLSGRSWDQLVASGHLTGAEPIIAALARDGTFRAISIVLSTDATARRFELDVSGAPRARAGRPFTGYAGFGLVRSVSVPSETRALPEGRALLISPGMATLDEPAPAARVPAPHPVGNDAQARVGSLAPAALTLAALSLAALVPAARFGLTWTSGSRTASATRRRAPDEALPEEAPAGSVSHPATPGNVVGRPSEGQTALSVNEHAAFREIARALGARFEGDEPLHADQESATVRGAGGSVTPFPGTRSGDARSPEPDQTDAVGLLAGIPLALLIHRGDAVLYANRRFLDLAGFDDLAALQARGGMADLFRGMPRALDEQPALETPSRSNGPVALMTRDGSRREAEVTPFAVAWDDAPAHGLILREGRGSGPDRSPSERTVRKADRTDAVAARTALDALDDGVVTLDAAGHVLSLNRAAAAFFGSAIPEVVGRSFVGLFDPVSTIAVRSSLQTVAGMPRTVTVPGAAGALSLVLRVLPGDGEGRRVAILRDTDAPDRWSSTSDQVHATADAAAAAPGTWKTDFLAKVSHEIRTPMNAILGFTDVMLKEQFGAVGTDRYRDYLRDIRTSGEHVLGLVNDLVDLARIEAGRFDLAFGPVSLNDLVASCVTLLQPQAARDRIVVRTSFAADSTNLLADERSMRQAALNIIANAIKYTEAGGQVIVSTTTAERGEIALRVRDTGIGMSTEEIEAVLQPFRQVSASGPRKGGGTGLGLPLTKAIIEANHGRFRITSRKDEGTLVEMLFPARQAKIA
ncbi:ATP-binding protein [Methylobacterium planeticum]|nr:ATP-binding protein [Methylobacterium planeticum]